MKERKVTFFNIAFFVQVCVVVKGAYFFVCLSAIELLAQLLGLISIFENPKDFIKEVKYLEYLDVAWLVFGEEISKCIIRLGSLLVNEEYSLTESAV